MIEHTMSYAQNLEDVLLQRAFPHKNGFYIDIGAADPFEFSVTKWFSTRGWTGINVEPQSYYFQKLKADRVRDTNLQMAISNVTCTMALFEFPTHRGFSTLDETVAEELRLRGIQQVTTVVPTITLAALCDHYAKGPIDFLKVDVEGHEKEVLESGDFSRYRPRIILVEATRQADPTPNHEAWEPVVLESDYLYATFDGLNRYYVAKEAKELVEVLQVQPNVYDYYKLYPYENSKKLLQEQIERLSIENSVLKNEVQGYQQAVLHLQSRPRLRNWLGKHARKLLATKSIR